MAKKLSFFKSLMYCSLFCRKDKQIRVRENAMVRFEKPLDIRSFVGVHTNLVLLLNLVLTKQ